MAIDLRTAINAISDVVYNRPAPAREFDQIFMKSADMLLHVDLVSTWFDERDVVFIGDGDAIALCSVYLQKQDLLSKGPKTVHVLGFDERVVRSVRQFALECGVDDRVTAELYNVRDPLPRPIWGRFDAFHTNPPFGKANAGLSVQAFVHRGLEAVSRDFVGCIVCADIPRDVKISNAEHWSQRVLHGVQQYCLTSGLLVAQLTPQFHSYHLDDEPSLTSCSMIVKQVSPCEPQPYASTELENAQGINFYGETKHIATRYLKALEINQHDYAKEGWPENGKDT